MRNVPVLSNKPAEHRSSRQAVDAVLPGRPAKFDGLGTLAFDPYEVSNLTRNQLQVWVAHNLLPDVPIFNLTTALHLEGEIDLEHFARAFRVLVDSSDALRAVVEEHDGIPMQRVLPQAPMPLDFLDLSQHPEAELRARTWMADRCEAPVDLRHALYDSTLNKIGQMHFFWYLKIHHMICDGWSIELIYRRLAELYRASLERSLPDRDDLRAFADYKACILDMLCLLSPRRIPMTI